MLRTIIVLAISLFPLSLAQAQSPREVLIAWGQGTAQLSVFADGDYTRGVLFFDVGVDDSLWIADAYKARVAHFSSKGNFLDEVPLDAISPRMTAFRRLKDGSVVVFNDQTLSRWSAKGELVGRTSLGLELPEGFWFTSERSSLVLSDIGGRFSAEFDGKAQPVSRFFLPSSQGTVAAVKDEADRILLFRWKDQARVFGWKSGVDPDAILVVGLADKATVWSRETQGIRTFWRVDGTGKLVGQFAIGMTPGASALFAFDREQAVVTGEWSREGLRLRWNVWQNPPQ